MTEKAAFWKPFVGTAVCAISAFCICLTNVLVKVLPNVDTLLIVSIRFWIIFLLSAPVSAIKEKSHFHSGSKTILLLRALMGTGMLIIQFYSLKYLPLADTMMISATAPVFTVFFARLFIKEPILLVDIVSVILVFFGILLVVKPPFLFGASELYTYDSKAIYSVLAMVLGSIVLQSNVFVTLRFLKGVHWSSVLSVFGLVGFIISITFLQLLGLNFCLPENGLELLYLVMIGVLSYLGQMGLTFSAQFESAASVALLRKSFDVIFAFIFQILFFKALPGWLSFVGAVLIFLAVILSGLKNLTEKKKSEEMPDAGLTAKVLRLLYSTPRVAYTCKKSSN